MRRDATVHATLALGVLCLLAGATRAERQMERLGRGLVAVHVGGGGVYVGWCLLGTDPEGIAFDLYRSSWDEGRCVARTGPRYGWPTADGGSEA